MERCIWAGVVSEYAYKAEPYQSRHEISMEEGRKERAQRLTDMPFKPSSCCRSKIYGLPLVATQTHTFLIMMRSQAKASVVNMLISQREKPQQC